MTGRIFRQVFANAVEVIATPARVTFKFAADQWKHFKKFVGRLDRWIDDDFTLQRDVPSLGQEGKGKSRRQAKALFLVAAALFKVQCQFGRKLASEIGRAS